MQKQGLNFVAFFKKVTDNSGLHVSTIATNAWNLQTHPKYLKEDTYHCVDSDNNEDASL